MFANLVGFGIGFGIFIVASVVLTVYVVRFAGRIGRRAREQVLPPSPPPQRSDGDAERDEKGS